MEFIYDQDAPVNGLYTCMGCNVSSETPTRLHHEENCGNRGLDSLRFVFGDYIARIVILEKRNSPNCGLLTPQVLNEKYPQLVERIRNESRKGSNGDRRLQGNTLDVNL